MFGFKKKNHFLGIDFGTSYIKVVELASSKSGRPTLVNYGQVEMGFTEGANSFQFHSPEERAKEYLKALLDVLKPETDSAYVSMPGFSGLITLLELPEMKPEELEQAIRFEAHQYIPSSLDEVSLSWDVISTKAAEDGTKKMEVLLVAALHKEVEKYERYVQSAGLTLEVLELETFSLTRSLVERKDQLCLIVDIGSRATNIILVEDGVIKVNRNLNSGGNEVTSTFADGFNVSWERAESLKKGSEDFLNTPESAIVFPTFELITGEMNRVLAAYKAKHPTRAVDAVILSGGTSKMKGLDTYFERVLRLPVVLGDPWKSVEYDPKLAPVFNQFGAAYSVSIGLALGGIDASLKK